MAERINRICQELADSRSILSGLQDTRLNDLLAYITARQSFCTVRSTGLEDTDTTANAGGNDSIEIVQPTPPAVMRAIGRVLASYFSVKSLQQRAAARDERLFNVPSLPVLIQEVAGEYNNHMVTSCVAYTQETYAKTPGVSLVQATYGHGKAVVDGLLPVDTYFMDPDNALYPCIRYKQRRLAPRDGSGAYFALTPTQNPTSIIAQQSLSHVALCALKKVLDTIEQYYGKPMDVELIIDQTDRIIYLVQARPIVDATQQMRPVYLKDLSLVASQDCIECDVVNAADQTIHHITSSKNVIVAQTLDDVLNKIIKGEVSLNDCVAVVAHHGAEATSHAGATFRGLGKVILQTANTAQLEQWLAQSGCSILLDSQRGAFINLVPAHPWTGKNLTALIDENIAVEGLYRFPVPNNYSVIAPEVDDCQRATEFSACRMMGRAEVDQLFITLKQAPKEEAQDALYMLLALIQRNIDTLHRLQKKFQGVDDYHSLQAAQALGKLQEVYQAACACSKTLTKTLDLPPTDGQRCFAITYLQALFNQPVRHDVVKSYSLENVLEQYRITLDFVVKNIKPLIAKGVIKPDILHHPELVHAAKIGVDAALHKKIAISWITFIGHLAQDCSDEQIEQFCFLIRQLDDAGIISPWLHCIFLAQDKANILREYRDGQEQLTALLSYKQQLAGFSYEGFASPDHVAKSMAFMQEQMTHLTSDDFCTSLKNEQACSPSLVRLAMFDVMSQAIEFFDTAIKTVKGSMRFDDEVKAGHVKAMIGLYLQLLKAWAPCVPEGVIQYHCAYPLNSYLAKLSEILANMRPLAEMLLPSLDFNVAGAMLGSAALFERHFPETLEDCFTTIHQSLLRCLSGFIQCSSSSLRKYWEIDKKLKQTIEAVTLVGAHLTGINFGKGVLTYTFSKPLSNHSASFMITHTKKDKQTMLTLSFYGQGMNFGRERWENIGMFAHFMNLFDEHAIQQVHVTNLGAVFTLPVTPKLLSTLGSYLQKSIDLANEASLTTCGYADKFAKLDLEQQHTIINGLLQNGLLQKNCHGGFVQEYIINLILDILMSDVETGTKLESVKNRFIQLKNKFFYYHWRYRTWRYPYPWFYSEITKVIDRCLSTASIKTVLLLLDQLSGILSPNGQSVKIGSRQCHYIISSILNRVCQHPNVRYDDLPKIIKYLGIFSEYVTDESICSLIKRYGIYSFDYEFLVKFMKIDEFRALLTKLFTNLNRDLQLHLIDYLKKQVVAQ